MTIIELKDRKKTLEAELRKINLAIKTHAQRQEKEKIKQVRELMEKLGVKAEQLQPKTRAPRKPKVTQPTA